LLPIYSNVGKIEQRYGLQPPPIQGPKILTPIITNKPEWCNKEGKQNSPECRG